MSEMKCLLSSHALCGIVSVEVSLSDTPSEFVEVVLFLTTKYSATRESIFPGSGGIWETTSNPYHQIRKPDASACILSSLMLTAEEALLLRSGAPYSLCAQTPQ